MGRERQWKRKRTPGRTRPLDTDEKKKDLKTDLTGIPKGPAIRQKASSTKKATSGQRKGERSKQIPPKRKKVIGDVRQPGGLGGGNVR